MHVGCDIVDMKRIKDEAAFVEAILAPSEKEKYAKAGNRIEFLAGHFAVKEAFMKALGTGMVGVPFTKIEVMYEPQGRPFVVYEGKRYEASISHDGGMAMAVVIV